MPAVDTLAMGVGTRREQTGRMQTIDRNELENVTGGNFLSGLQQVLGFFQSPGFQQILGGFQSIIGSFAQLGQGTSQASPTGQAPAAGAAGPTAQPAPQGGQPQAT